jgi:hypothetical protein
VPTFYFFIIRAARDFDVFETSDTQTAVNHFQVKLYVFRFVAADLVV